MAATSPFSSVLEKRPHPHKGHALHAKRAFAAGQPIAHFTPTILVPTTSHLAVLCTHCLSQPPAGPRACTRCHAAFYCSPECQTLHWRAVHAKECKPLSKVREREGEGKLLPTLVRAALQAAVKPEIGARLEGLEGHTQRWMQTERWKGRGVDVAATAVTVYSGRKDMTTELAAGIISKVRLARYAVYRWENASG